MSTVNMENRSTPLEKGGMPSRQPNRSLSPVAHERIATEPESPGKNPVCMGKFGLRRSHSVAQSKNIPRVHTSAVMGAANILRRGEKSSQLLDRRPPRRGRSKDLTSESKNTQGVREGRQFTVGNVGQNGKIYLRPVPIANQAFHSRAHSQSPCLADDQKNLQSTPLVEEARHSFWSNSQTPDLWPLYARGSSMDYQDGVPNAEYSAPRLNRRHSLSTLGDEFHPSPSERRGELRIVIERPDMKEFKSPGKTEIPSLEIPIPHYRLGGFRFTQGGTPMLRSSAYTRTSVSDNFRSSTFMKTDRSGVPPIPSEIVSTGPSLYTPPLFPSSRAFSGVNTSPAQSSVFYKLKEPIEPSAFDTLLTIMDDPSVVRYAKGTKQVTAATPARIVAQISSDSFMDYELVSDFFLTFRSYLSHTNLLSLLMARLEWAINRLEDDGRIIRIRVFAALRHWILNYFTDDFVPNRDLRTHFCDKLNQMYENIKRMSKNSKSDLKILVDLKKCWNGRCALYWESQESADGKDADDPIVPGGMEGSNNGELSPRDLGGYEHTLAMHAQPAISAQFLPAAWDSRGHQKAPEPVVEAQTSPISPSTIHATSCSLPQIITKRNSFHANQGESPHPVLLASPKLSSPVSPRQFNFPSMPPIWRRPMHSHKRSGSFSDSVRDDRAPLPLSNFDSHGQPLGQMSSHNENIIRGNVYGPPEPLLLPLGPPSPNFEVPPVGFGQSDPTNRSDGPKPPGPGMKNFIGTLRRALQNRPPGNHGNPRGLNSTESRGKTSPLPRNVSFRPNGYRVKTGMHSCYNTRVDLLCEEAYSSYLKVLKEAESSGPSISQTTALSDVENEGRTSADLHEKPGYLTARRHDSIPSQLTTGSKSIVIVDDTRTGAPFMSGGLHISLSAPKYIPSQLLEDHSLRHDQGPKPLAPLTTTRDTPLDRDSFGDMFEPMFQQSKRQSALFYGTDSAGDDKPFRGLRKYASHESVMTKHSRVFEIDLMNRSELSHASELKRRGPMLRRRPGGDLRKMQHGLELEAKGKAVSTDDLTETSSMAGSLLQMADVTRFNDGIANSGPRRQRYSLDEPRNIRRTFEATVAGFAKIPDDDDGGIESTLLKLEGKWEPQLPIHPAVHVKERNMLKTSGMSATGSDNLLRRVSSTSGIRISSFAESEDSYCSVPLLERGLTDESMKSPRAYDMVLNTQSHLSDQEPIASTETEGSLSIEMVEKTDSMQQLPLRTKSLENRKEGPYDNDPEMEDYASELSSEISIDIIDGAEGNSIPNQDGQIASPIMSFATLGVPTHPLADPPSPPMTLGNHAFRTSDTHPPNLQRQPLTPEFSPTGIASRRNSGRAKHLRSHTDRLRLNLEAQLPCSPAGSFTSASHTPFILAYDSELLARQFAIVEQAALSEVDWKDLVDMKWSHSSHTTLNWVNYLADQDRKGIDMVVARFNLMVKWALSEIVMTTNRTLRVNTITKLIHVAVYSRRVRNYATMLQITIALCSVDCTRLTKTWELVPDGEKQLLKEMELLIQPTRNFHNLRSEMETCNLQEGCIPFVGLYVQDLTYNSQKPAQIASTRDGEPLVNFERYRTAAAIVKSLLRLIDASTKYNFEPIYGLVERCLWIASLTDDKIIALSKELE
ncbi:predicted protein [Uncinocarpus reesii 1704]|uniref:Guanine nucleotide exchange factor LTE1 n=1 Tax=Uncinocarpus reesii (strain UAMH 1704) TaxID=336963 RepID=C4JYI0_UNCRE|nr:uncharacterized protein UREG_07231 [Uncinocarpus reesii 1704]EEP82366.1 predicted protein [Uncinocarpus reesii 1704]